MDNAATTPTKIERERLEPAPGEQEALERREGLKRRGVRQGMQRPSQEEYEEQRRERAEAEARSAWNNEDDEWELYGNQMLPTHVAQLVRKVNENYDQAIDKFIATGQALLEMKAGVDYGEWLLLFKRKIPRVGIRTAEKYMKIAKHAAISDSQNSAKVPRSPDALEYVSTIKSDVVQALIDKRIISQTTTIEQARRLPAVALPKALDALFEIAMREDAAETAELIAHHLWWVYIQKDQGDGAAQNLIDRCADWLATFGAAYGTVHQQYRSEWLAEADEAINQKRQDKARAKITARKRKSNRRSYFGRAQIRRFN